jgi:hypothetical protein
MYIPKSPGTYLRAQVVGTTSRFRANARPVSPPQYTLSKVHKKLVRNGISPRIVASVNCHISSNFPIRFENSSKTSLRVIMKLDISSRSLPFYFWYALYI